MNLRQLECACAIWRCGSVSAAAKELGITQQALSKTLGALEEELGVRLFLRGSKGMVPTPETLLLLDDAQSILLDVELFKEAAARQRNQADSNIIVGVEPGLIGGSDAPLVIEALMEFTHTNLDDRIEFREMPVPLVEHQVQMGTLDLGLVSGFPPSNCNGEVIYSSPIKAVVSSELPLSKQSTIHWKDLEGFDLVITGSDNRLKDRVQESCRQAGFEPSFIPQVAQFGGNVGMVHGGTTVFLCHDKKRVMNLGAKRIKVIDFPVEEQVNFNLCFIWNEYYVLTEPALALRDFVKKNFALSGS